MKEFAPRVTNAFFFEKTLFRWSLMYRKSKQMTKVASLGKKGQKIYQVYPEHFCQHAWNWTYYCLFVAFKVKCFIGQTRSNLVFIRWEIEYNCPFRQIKDVFSLIKTNRKFSTTFNKMSVFAIVLLILNAVFQTIVP